MHTPDPSQQMPTGPPPLPPFQRHIPASPATRWRRPSLLHRGRKPPTISKRPSASPPPPQYTYLHEKTAAVTTMDVAPAPGSLAIWDSADYKIRRYDWEMDRLPSSLVTRCWDIPDFWLTGIELLSTIGKYLGLCRPITRASTLT